VKIETIGKPTTIDNSRKDENRIFLLNPFGIRNTKIVIIKGPSAFLLANIGFLTTMSMNSNNIDITKTNFRFSCLFLFCLRKTTEYKKPMKGIIKKVFRIIKDLITEYFSKPLLWYNNLSIIKS